MTKSKIFVPLAGATGKNRTEDGLQVHGKTSELSLKEKAQLYRHTLKNQLMKLNKVVGASTGANHAYNTVTGTADPSDPLFMRITFFNLANFAWYSYQTIKAT